MLSAISFGVFCRSAPSTRRDHAVEEGRARRRRDAHHDPVRQHLRAAGHGRAVAADFADDRRRLAGDRGLVDRGHALDHLAVGGDEVAGLDQHDVARPEARCRERPVRRSARAGQHAWPAVSVRVRRRVSACALPRPSAIASAKLANSTVNQSQRMIWTVKPRCSAAGDEVADEEDGGQRAPRPRPRTSPGS